MWNLVTLFINILPSTVLINNNNNQVVIPWFLFDTNNSILLVHMFTIAHKVCLNFWAYIYETLSISQGTFN